MLLLHPNTRWAAARTLQRALLNKNTDEKYLILTLIETNWGGFIESNGGSNEPLAGYIIKENVAHAEVQSII